MKNKSDIRFKILDYLNQNGKSTEEIESNNYLATLHSDLGTIRRTLKELIEKGYICESNINWNEEKDNSVIYNINTTGPKEKKCSTRLLNKNDIDPIRLYLTLEGKKFLIESENLKFVTFSLKYRYVIQFIIIIFTAIVTAYITHIFSIFK